MTLTGNDQNSLLMLLYELTALRQCVALCALPAPCPNLALNSICIARVCSKSEKKLAENKKEKEDAALGMEEAAVCHLVNQKDFKPAEETKPSFLCCYLLSS